MSWLEFWAFLRYDLRLSEREATTMPPYRIISLAQRQFENRRWLSSRIAVLACCMASRKDGQPLKPRDVFPELADWGVKE